MALPYENTTSGEKALGEIQRVLRTFGCNKFGNWSDEAEGTLTIQFEYRGRAVSVKASTKGYAAAWLKEHPFNSNHRYSLSRHHERAKEVAAVAIYSVLRDWIKGQVTAIETGILSFDGAFLGQVLLPSGKTVLETAHESRMLPPLVALEAR